MKEGIKLGKNTLILAIMTLITVIVWIGVEVYSTLQKTTIPQVTRDQMTKLDPTFKENVIRELEKRVWFSEEEFINLNFSQLVSSLEEGIPSTLSGK